MGREETNRQQSTQNFPSHNKEDDIEHQIGYLFFSQEKCALVRAELEAKLKKGGKLKKGEKLKTQDVVTHLAGLWKALKDEEKAEWNEKAKPGYLLFSQEMCAKVRAD